jgi:hypothetical protein
MASSDQKTENGELPSTNARVAEAMYKIAMSKLDCQNLLVDTNSAVGASMISNSALFDIITDLVAIILRQDAAFEGLTQSTHLMTQALLTVQNQTKSEVLFTKAQGTESLVHEQKIHAEGTLAQATADQKHALFISGLLTEFVDSMAESARRATEAAETANEDEREALRQAAADATVASQTAADALAKANEHLTSIQKTIADVTTTLQVLLDSICPEVIKVPLPASIQALQQYTILTASTPVFLAGPVVIGDSGLLSDAQDTPETLSTQTLLTTLLTDASGRSEDTTQPQRIQSVGTFGTHNNPIVPGVHRYTNGLNIDMATFFIEGTGFGRCEGVTDVFIIQVYGTLDMATTSRVVLSNGALPENVFWYVEDKVNLAAGAQMVGTLLVQEDVGFGANASLHGRIYTRKTVVGGASVLIVEPNRTNESSDRSIQNKEVQRLVMEHLQDESRRVVTTITEAQKKADQAAQTALAATVSLTGATVQWQADTDVLINIEAILSAQKLFLNQIEMKRTEDRITILNTKLAMQEQRCREDTLAATESHNDAMQQAAIAAETLALVVQGQEETARTQAVTEAVRKALAAYSTSTGIVNTGPLPAAPGEATLAATVAATVAAAVASAIARGSATTLETNASDTTLATRLAVSEAHVVRLEEQMFTLASLHGAQTNTTEYTGESAYRLPYRLPPNIVNTDARRWSRRHATASVVSAGVAALTRRDATGLYRDEIDHFFRPHVRSCEL